MASVIERIFRLMRQNSATLYGIVFFFALPVLGYAGVGNTKHDFSHKDQEQNCSLCHPLHTNKAQPFIWKPEDVPADIKKNFYFTLSKEEEVLCLSCHDGILAKDICVILSHEFVEEEISLLKLPEINRYYNKRMIFLSTCEKHYNLLSYFQSQLLKQKLTCATCHDVHHLRGSSKTGLITGNVYLLFKYELCYNCHQKWETPRYKP